MPSKVRKHLPIFQINSGNWSRFPEVSLRCANEFPSSLLKLLNVSDESKLPDYSLRDSNSNQRTSWSNEASTLGELFRLYGSDKDSHGYTPLYESLISRFSLEENLKILEIGVGTNSPGKLSSMGFWGKPGASLLAFDSYLGGHVELMGLDIDKDIFFDHPRISFSEVDQLSEESWSNLMKDLGEKCFDIIIDDGLHSITANMNTISFARHHLSPNGYLVIEDVSDKTLTAWSIINVLEKKLNNEFRFSRFRGHRSNIILVERI